MTLEELSKKLGFNTEAMIKPKTPQDILACLKEVQAEAKNINEILKRAFDDKSD